MKLQVHEQVRLPLRRCVELVVSGIQFRLFRAAITVGIIALAVAFLMTMLTEGFTAREVAKVVDQRTAGREKLLEWVSRLSTPMTGEGLNSLLIQARNNQRRAEELRYWGDLSESDLETLTELAWQRKMYLDFFAAQPEGTRRAMVGRARGAEILDVLSEPEQLEQFWGKLSLAKTQFPAEQQQFRDFLQRYNETRDLRERIVQGHREALAKVDEKFQQKRPVEILAQGGDDLPEAIEPFGYRMSDETLQTVREQARLSLDVEEVTRLLTVRQIKARLAERTRISRIADVTQQTLLNEVDSQRGAEWLVSLVEKLRNERRELAEELPKIQNDVAELSQRVEGLRTRLENLPSDSGERTDVRRLLEEAEGDLAAAVEQRDTAEIDLRSLEAARAILEGMDLTPERIATAAEMRLEQQRLADVESAVGQAAAGNGVLGFSSRAVWLIVVSLMVCVVGIANAMLMSVTERFKEIATMKCLGATDGFIMINFILESCFQGLAGGIIGSLLGLGLGVVRSALKYGALSFSQLPALEVLAAAGVAIGIGITLSAMAAMYPAWVAARLAPMEAMRIE
ncbi:MAG: FtsX-like permease family protein [Phycisphaerae bacterium]